MREIKFRAWVESKKALVDVLSIDFKEKTVRLPIQTSAIAEYWWKETTWNFEDVVLMQYTGLKDRRGIEIYEGDIVHFTFFNRYVNETNHKCIVKYRNGIYEIWKNNDSDFLESDEPFILNYAWLHTEEFEVIGNIYENSELLGVKNNV